MKSKLENTTSPKEAKEFEENTLYVIFSPNENKELISQKIGSITKKKISKTLLDRIAAGCSLVEKKNEVGSLYPFLDVLVCPLEMAIAANDGKIDSLTVYLEDILLANENYHKKSIIQFALVDESIISVEGTENLKELIPQIILENTKQAAKEILF